MKFTHKKTIENEVGGLRLKLSESQQYASQLQTQLQLIKSTNRQSIATTTTTPPTSTDLNNNKDLNLNLNNATNNAELLSYLKRLKHENNELKIQIESERRRFSVEKEKWYLQFQTCMQNKRNSVNISTDNLSVNSNLLYSTTTGSSIHQYPTSKNTGNYMNSPAHNNFMPTSTTANNNINNNNKFSVSKTKPFIKNVLFNQQHFL